MGLVLETNTISCPLVQTVERQCSGKNEEEWEVVESRGREEGVWWLPGEVQETIGRRENPGKDVSR